MSTTSVVSGIFKKADNTLLTDTPVVFKKIESRLKQSHTIVGVASDVTINTHATTGDITLSMPPGLYQVTVVGEIFVIDVAEVGRIYDIPDIHVDNQPPD